MPAFDHTADRSNVEGSAEASAAPSHVCGSGIYLTDETFLYRIESIVGSRLDEMVAVEDCYLLDSVRVRLNYLHVRRLRVVTPAPD